MKKKLSRHCFTIVGFLLLITIIAFICQPPVLLAQSKQPVKLGLLAPTTTENSLLGKSIINGSKMAVEEINAAGGIGGAKIELIEADVANSNTVAVNALQRVLADKPAAIIGHIWSTMTIAQNPYIQEAGLPFFYTGSSNKLSKLGNPWMFRIAPNDDVMGRAAAAFVVDELKFKKIGILYSNEEYGIAGKDVIIDVLTKRGVKPLAIEAHGPGDKDMAAQLLKLKNAGSEIIIGWSFPVPTAITVRQIKELNLGISYLGGRSMTLTAMLGLAKEGDLDGTYGSVDSVIATNPDPKVQAWAKKYNEKYNREADWAAAEYYDLGYMLKYWIEKAGTKSDDLRKAILATKNYRGIGAVYSFQENGESINRASIMKYEGKNPKLIKIVEVDWSQLK